LIQPVCADDMIQVPQDCWPGKLFYNVGSCWKRKRKGRVFI